MDPYIEQPKIWGDFHSDLAGELRAQLNRQIQPKYFARLIPYETYEVVEVDRPQSIRPGFGVYRTPSSQGGVSVSSVVITPPTVESTIPLEMPLTVYSIEVRLTGPESLVTAIEILSPVNKRPSHEAYQAYRRKRRNLLRSAAHFIEIDLLRAGERPQLEEPVPPSPYYAMVSREELRTGVEVWCIQLADRLPVLPVPLQRPDPDAAIDLGRGLTEVYERGAYTSRIDYSQVPPPPPLAPDEAGWVDNLLKQYR